MKTSNKGKRKLVKLTIFFLYTFKSLIIVLTWMFLLDRPMTVLAIDAIIPPLCICGIIIISGFVIKRDEKKTQNEKKEVFDFYLSKTSSLEQD